MPSLSFDREPVRTRSTTLSSAHIPAHLRRPYSEAVPRLARAFSQEERIRVSTRWRSECRTRPMRCALRGWTGFRVARPARDLAVSIALYRDLLRLDSRGGFENHDGYDGVFFALP